MKNAPTDVYDPFLTSHHLDGRAPRLDPVEPVPLHHLVRAAALTGLAPAEIAARLAGLAYHVPDAAQLATVTDEDTRLVSRELDGAAPWISTDFTSELRSHIVWASAELGRSPAGLAARYAALGYRAPDPAGLPATPPQDSRLVRQSLQHTHHLLDEKDSTLRGHILWAARETKRSASELAAWFAAHGYRAPDPASLPDRIPELLDTALASEDGASSGPFTLRDEEAPVSLRHVLSAVIHARAYAKDPHEGRVSRESAVTRPAELGYRTTFDVVDITDDDVLLIREKPDDRSEVLDENEQVPVLHILRFAERHGRNPNALVMRLIKLGYKRVPKGSLADRVDAEELSLAEFTHGGEDFRLAHEDPDWFRHLVAAGARTGRPPAEIANRLRALGFRIPETALAPSTSDEDVQLIGAVRVVGHASSVRPAEPVPVSHILHAAHTRGTPVSAILSRLRELGCTRLPRLRDHELTEDDLRLLSEEGDGQAPWLADTVPYGRVLYAASATGRSVQEVADRYRELGYAEVDLPAGPLPASLSEPDTELVVVRPRTRPSPPRPRYWLPLDEPVPLWHILQRAEAEGVAPAEIGKRLGGLGFHRLPAPLPDTASHGDLVLVSENHDGEGPWLDRDGTVPSPHVHQAARRLGMNPHDAATRLLALGHTLEYTPQPEDALIAGQNAERSYPWHRPYWSLGNILLSAETLGRTPAGIAVRLAELGHGWQIPPGLDDFDEEDIRILSERLDSRAPWIARSTPPSLQHVLRAAQATGRTPQDIAERLTALDHPVQVSPEADVRDLHLMEQFTWRMQSPLQIEDVLELVRKTGRSPADLAARLPELGYEVPDADYPTERPAPTPPRRA